MSESDSEKQYRLRNETECRRIADIIKAQLSPGLGFVLVTTTVGDAGKFSNMSYVASINRDDSARLLTELLDHWRPSNIVCEPTVQVATFLREIVYSIRATPWKRLLHGARCSLRDAEAARTLGNVERAKTEVLKLASEALALFDQLNQSKATGN